MLKGGDLGPALVPGNAEASLLFEAIRYQDDDLQMPPDGRLDDLEVEKMRQWIELGAAHPRPGPEMEDEGYTGPLAEELRSVQPFAQATPPRAASNPIDAFLEAALDEAGLTKSPVAPSGNRARSAGTDGPSIRRIDCFGA